MKCSQPGACQLRVPALVFAFVFVVLVLTPCLWHCSSLFSFCSMMGGGKLFAKLLHLCSLRRSWRRQLMDIEHPFAFASQVSSGAFKVFPAYLQLTSVSPVQCKISSRNELNCNTFWCPIRSYLCIIKSNTCSEALMSPLQLNYSAARADRERINAKVLNGQNNVHVNGQTKVHAYHIPPLPFLPPLAV